MNIGFEKYLKYTTKERVLAIFLFLILFQLEYSRIRNTHIHIFSNATVIFHFHPYNTDSSQETNTNHKHTKSELLILSLLNNIISCVGFFLLILFIFSTLQLAFHILTFKYINIIKISNPRAPPLFQLINS